MSDLGYQNHYKVLNAKDFDVPQNRNRVFIVSIKESLNQKYIMPKGNKLNKSIEDILQKNVRDKYYLSQKAKKRLQDKKRFDIINKKTDEIVKYIDDNFRKAVYQINGISPTVIESHGDVVRIKVDDGFRKITPLEAFRLMGFDDKDYFKAKKEMERVFYYGHDKSDTRLYKAAGKSIVVPVLEEIFKNLFRGRG